MNNTKEARAVGRVVGLLVSAGLLSATHIASARVTPIAEQAEFSGNEMIVTWGYLNTGTLPIFFPFDADENGFTPAPIDRGQGVEFSPGRNESVFTTNMPVNTDLFWVLDLTFAAVRADSFDTPTDIDNAFVLSAGSGLRAPSITVTNGGQLSVAGGAAFSTGATNVNVGGQMTIVDDSIDVGSLNNAGSLVVSNSQITGPVVNQINATTDITGIVTFTDLVSGAGNFTGTGTALFEGGYSPGDDTSEVFFGGSTEFGATNTLSIDLDGVLAGEFDRLEIAGDAILDGLLDVSALDPLALPVGSEFEILDIVGTRSGQFVGLPEGAEIDLGSGNRQVVLSYLGGDGNDVVLTLVPEPTSAILVTLVALIFVKRRGGC